ncbi:MAG: hypothetical protein AAFY60_14175, partial [Myxococcota bacterium]
MRWLIPATMVLLAAAPRGASANSHTPSEVLSDLETAYQGLKKAHYDLYANATRAELDEAFEQSKSRLQRRADPLSTLEATVFLQKFIAHANTAHARVDMPVPQFMEFLRGGGKLWPFEVRVDQGRLWVSDSLDGYAGLAEGDEIVQVNGEKVGRWLERLVQHISAENRGLAESILTRSFRLQTWIEHPDVESFELTVRRDERELTYAAATLSGEEIEARRAAQGAKKTRAEREARLLPGGVAYLRTGAFYNVESPEHLEDTHDFIGFVDSAFELFSSSEARALIVDLRSNPGG